MPTMLSQVTLSTQIVSEQLYRDNKKIMQQHLLPEENSITVQLK